MKRIRKRRYSVDFYQHGHCQPNGWNRLFASNAKIGEVASELFRKWFGRAPDRLFWRANGFMAGARDKRGNEILVTQLNGHAGFVQNLDLLALPWKEAA